MNPIGSVRHGMADPTERSGARNTKNLDPFRCRMWDFHDRLENLISETTCSAEISSFSKQGQLVPAIGRPLMQDPDHDIELICGARRLFIARHLNVPLLVEIREMTDREAIIAMDIENRQRQELSAYERGLNFARLLRAGHFESQEDIARGLQISQSQVSRLLTLASLPSVVVAAFSNCSEIREGWGPELLAASTDPRRRRTTIARARALAASRLEISASDVYTELTSSAGASRKLRTRGTDEVILAFDGSPLFRIRFRDKDISFVIRRVDVSQSSFSAIRDAVRDVLQKRSQSEPSAVSAPLASETTAKT